MAAGDTALNIIIGATDNASSVIMGLGNALQQLASGNVMGAIGTAAGAVAGGIAQATTAAGDFQQQLTLLVTSANESSNNLKAVGDGILQISTDTGTATDQLTSGMYMIESAGYHGQQGLDVLRIAAEGAKAENADLTGVAKALTSVMHDYNIPFDQAAAAMNTMTQTVADGKLKLNDLATSLGYVLPIASELHVSLPQVTAALATMTNAGMSSFHASQNLAFSLRALSSPSSVAVTQLKDIGLTAQQLKDALSTQGLSGALQLVEDHISKKFPAGSVQAQTALKDIMGGAAGLNTALALSGDKAKYFAGSITDITAALRNGTGEVMNWSLVQDTLNFQMDRVKASFDAMMISIGTEFLPIMTKLMDNVANAVVGFTHWEEQTHFVADAVQVAVTVIEWLVTAIGKVVDVLSQLWSLIEPTFNQLIASAEVWGKNFMVSFGNGIIAVANDIIAIVEQIAQEIENYLGFASPAKKGPGSKLASWGPGLIQGFADGITSSIPLVTDAVTGIVSQFQALSDPASMQAAGGPNITNFTDALTGDSRKVTVTQDKMPDQKTNTPAAHAAAAGQHISNVGTAIAGGAGKVASATSQVTKALSTVCDHAKAVSKCAADHLTTHLASKITAQSPAAQAAAAKHAAAVAAAAAKAQDTANAKAANLNTDWQKAISTSSTQAVQDLVNKSKAEFAKGNTAMATFYAQQAIQLANQQAAAAKKTQAALAKLGPAPVAGAQAPDLTIPGKDVMPDNPITKASNAVKAASVQLGPAATAVKNAWMSVLQVFSQVAAVMNQVAKAMTPGLQDIWRVIQTELVPSLKSLWDAVKPGVVALGQLMGAIVVGTAAFAKWMVTSGTLKAIWDGLVVVIKVVIATVSTLIGALSAALGPTIAMLVGTFNDSLKPALTNLWEALKAGAPVFKFVGGVIGVAFIAVLGVVVGLLGGIMKGLGNFLQGVIIALGGIIQFVSGFVQVFIGWWQLVYDVLTGNWKKVGKDLDVIWHGIQDMWNGFWKFVWGVIWAVGGAIIGFFDGFVHTIIGFFQNLYNALVGHSIIPDLVNGIMSWFKNLWNFLEGIVNTIVTWIVNQFITFRDKTIAYWTAVYTGIVQVLKQIQSGVQTAITFVINWLQKQWQTFQTNVQTAWTAVQTIIQKTANGISTWLGGWIAGLITAAVQWGLNLMKSFANSITQGVANVTAAVTGVAAKIKSFLGIASPAQQGPLSTADQWMPNFMTMLANGIKINTPKVTIAVTGVANQFTLLTTNVNTSVNNINTKIGTLGNTLPTASNKITSNLNLLTTQVKTSADNINTSMNGVGTNSANVSNQVGNSWHYIGWTVTTSSTLSQQAAKDLDTCCQNVSNNVCTSNTKMTQNTQTTAQTMGQSFNSIGQQASDAWNNFNDTMTKWGDGMKTWTNDLQTKLNNFFRSLFDPNSSLNKQIFGWIDSTTRAVGDFLKELGKNIGDSFSGFITSSQNFIGQAITMAQSAAQQIAAILGHSTPTSGPLKDDDQWGKHMMQNIASGMRAGMPELTAAANQAAGIMQSKLSPSFALSGGSKLASPMVIYMSLDGKTIGKVVTKYQVGELHVQGGIRSI